MNGKSSLHQFVVYAVPTTQSPEHGATSPVPNVENRINVRANAMPGEFEIVAANKAIGHAIFVYNSKHKVITRFVG